MTPMDKPTRTYPFFGFAPGGYWCKCPNCGKRYDGDKRSYQCEPCAEIEAAKQQAAPVSSPMDKLVSLLARNACDAYYDRAGTFDIRTWPEVSGPGEREIWERTVRAILKEVETFGLPLSDLVEGRKVAVPVSTRQKAAKLTYADLKVGQVHQMKRGGLRRIDHIAQRRNVSEQWADVHWTRIDEGPYQGRTGRQAAAYFADASAAVISQPTPADAQEDQS